MIYRNKILSVIVLSVVSILTSAAIAEIEGFKTDTSKKIIEPNELQSGGPGKDGIPSIDSPKFISIEAAGKCHSTRIPPALRRWENGDISKRGIFLI